MNLEQLNQWNEQLNGLPAGTLTLVICWAVGAFVKMLPVVNNRWIPPAVMLSGLVVYPGLVDSLAGRQEIARSLGIGFVLGVAAFITHHFALHRLEDWLGAKVPAVGRLLGHSSSEAGGSGSKVQSPESGQS